MVTSLKSSLLIQAVTAVAGLATYPWDTVRRRMMMQVGRQDVLYKNSFHCLRKIMRKEGMRGLFKGSLSNIYRGVGGALVMAVYEEIQKHLKKRKAIEKPSARKILP